MFLAILFWTAAFHIAGKYSRIISPFLFTQIFRKYFLIMKVELELFGASRDLSEKDFLEFYIEEKISVKDFKKKIINYVDKNFKGNESFKKIIETSTFCSEDNNIISDNYIIIKDQKIGIIPPIGGG